MKSIAVAFLVIGNLIYIRAGVFQNLGFEEANINNVVPLGPGAMFGYFGTTADLLPSWQLAYGVLRPTGIGLNSFALDAGYYTLAARNAGNVFFNTSAFPIEGNYALFLSPRIPFQIDQYEPQSILQSGCIPLDVGQIQFLTFGCPMELRVNGSVLPLTYSYLNPGVFPPDLRYGTAVGDISAFAGQDVELRFSTTVSGAYINGIDDIRFIPVPEPGAWALWGLGGLLIASRLRRTWK